MKGIYLAAYKAYHPGYDIIYQDINNKRDIAGDMMEIDLSDYDFIIATPPCNYYSRARGGRKPSKYALETAHLLPDIIYKLSNLNKPFIVENVRNDKMFSSLGLFDYKNIYVYRIGRHTYWSSCSFNTYVNQFYDFTHNCNRLNNFSQGGINVYLVIENWLKEIYNNY